MSGFGHEEFSNSAGIVIAVITSTAIPILTYDYAMFEVGCGAETLKIGRL